MILLCQEDRFGQGFLTKHPSPPPPPPPPPEKALSKRGTNAMVGQAPAERGRYSWRAAFWKQRKREGGKDRFPPSCMDLMNVYADPHLLSATHPPPQHPAPSHRPSPWAQNVRATSGKLRHRLPPRPPEDTPLAPPWLTPRTHLSVCKPTGACDSHHLHLTAHRHPQPYTLEGHPLKIQMCSSLQIYPGSAGHGRPLGTRPPWPLGMSSF